MNSQISVQEHTDWVRHQLQIVSNSIETTWRRQPQVMKFFGWVRKKDPPPIFPRPPLDREFKLHTEYEDQPQSTRYLAKEYVSKDPALVDNLETWEEKLQETIRVVFSHEQEGLLAIGTFALDQLAGVTSSTHITDHHHSTPCSSSSTTTTKTVQVLIREVRSSDDEPDSITDPESDYPVFGDPGSVITARPSTPPPARKTPLPEIKATTASPGTEHVEDRFDSDQEFYSPVLCGLLPSRSQRLQKRKKLPEKMKKKGEAGAKETASLNARLRRLWRSGVSVSARVSPEKNSFAPEAGPQVKSSQAQGPPCIANVKELASEGRGEQQRKRRGHSFGKGWASCAHSGNWIRTDSEFVVLEM